VGQIYLRGYWAAALVGAVLMIAASAGLASAAVISGGAFGGPQTSAIDDGGGGGGGDGGGGGGGDTPRHQSATVLSCLVVQLEAGVGTTCTASVRDTVTPATDLGGKVTFSSDDPADLLNPKECTLQRVGTQFRCSVEYKPAAAGLHLLTVAYEGDSGHTPSASPALEFTATVPAGNGGGGGSGGGGGGSGGGGNPNPPPPPSPVPVMPPAELPPVRASAPARTMPPPNTSLLDKPPKKTASRRARFALLSDQGGSKFECKLDGKPFKACASLFQASVGPGQHTLRVRAVNAGGLADPTPVVARWKVS